MGSAGLFALLILLSRRLSGLRARPDAVLAATVAGLWLEPMFQTPLSGQIALALSLACPVGPAPAARRARQGLRAGHGRRDHPHPGAADPVLLLTDRIRAGLTALGAFAGTGLLGLLVVPGASAEFWSRHPPAGGRSLLLAWPHLWVRTVSLLTALLAAALRLRRRAAGAQAAAESTGEEPVGEEAGGEQASGEEAAGVPRDGQPSASSSSASMIR